MYTVSAKLIVSAEKYDVPGTFSAHPLFHRSWKSGDLVVPHGTKRFRDSGVSFILLKEHTLPEWLELVSERTKDAMSFLRRNSAEHPPPELSIYIETDGSDFPPLNFDLEWLKYLASFNISLDIDVVNCL